MPSLQVRELPDHIYEILKGDARREHRSLAQQAVVVLEKGLGVRANSKDRRRRILEQVETEPLIRDGATLKDPVMLVREDRER